MRRTVWLGLACLPWLAGGWCVVAGPAFHVRALGEDERPALVFLDGQADHKTALCVATFAQGEPRVERILWDTYLTVERVGRATFFVQASTGARKATACAIDLERGIAAVLAETTKLQCLGSDPSGRKAILARVDRFVPEVVLMRLELQNLLLLHDRTLPQGIAREIDGPMRISPDFRFLAYTHMLTPKDEGPKHVSTHALRLVDLETMKVRDIDTNVRVELSPWSSFAFGRPPFEWIGDSRLVYQVVPPAGSKTRVSRDHVLRVADVGAQQIVDRLRAELPLAIDGGSLRRDPVGGTVTYQHEWRVDLEKWQLVPKDEPYAVSRLGDGRCRIRRGEMALHEGEGSCHGTLLSPSGRHFACILRTDEPDHRLTLYAFLDGAPGPITVLDSHFTTLRPVAWIETTAK